MEGTSFLSKITQIQSASAVSVHDANKIMPLAAANTQMAVRMFNAPPTLSRNEVNGRVPMSFEQNNANKTANFNASTVHRVGMTKYRR